METITLKAEQRNLLGRKTRALKRAGFVPGVLYGKNFEPIKLSVSELDLQKTFDKVGESTLIDLLIGDKAEKVLIKEIQRDPITDKLIHVDFHKVSLTEKIHTRIPLIFKGESRAVKELDGILVRNVDELEVECLPQYLVHEIVVDISSLNTFNDMIRLKDLSIPSGIEIENLHSEDVIVTVSPPRVEEEIAPAGKPEEAVEKVELVTKKEVREEEEEAEEGE